MLNSDLKHVSLFFEKNALVINLKAGKTESMLLGTSKKLQKNRSNLKLFYRNNAICVATKYKYLGTMIDQTLNLSYQFDKMYKQVASKLKLLNKLKLFLNDEATKRVYQSLIQPLMKYNCIVNLNFTDTQRKKLQSIDRRAMHIVSNDFKVNSIDMIYKHAVLTVKKCLDTSICENYVGYFRRNTHEKVTRNNSLFLKIPKVKLEFAKQSFYFQGVKLFNSLPIRIRQAEASGDFKKELKSYSFQ